MKNILRIFRNDLQTIAKNIVVFVVIIGISLLPALYAWFNIAANWDPYSATSGLAFAVCSLDEGYTYKALTVRAGDQIVENLRANHQMGWHFVSEREALDGVADGTYYAAVIIPENFSENLCSVTTGTFRQAQLEYYVNQKKNAVAPKITDKGVSAIESEVNDAYVSTITSVVATTLHLTADELSGEKGRAVKTVTDSLEEVVENIDTLDAGVDVFVSTLDTLQTLLKTNQNLLPEMAEAFSLSGTVSSDVKGTIEAARTSSRQIGTILADMIGSLDTMQDSVEEQLNIALDQLKTDTSEASASLLRAAQGCDKIIVVNRVVIGVLENLETNFGISTSAMRVRLENAIARQQTLSDKLVAAATSLADTRTLSQSLMDELKQTASDCRSDISQLSASFAPVKTAFDKVVEDMYTVLEDTSTLIQVLNGGLSVISQTLTDTQDTIDALKETFQNLQKLLDNSKTKTNALIERVEELDTNSTIHELLLTIIKDPQALGEFVAEPVTTVTHDVHPVENYGSGMAPFYTSLSFWVGGTILIAILRTEPTKKQLRLLDNASPVEQYFGRYLIFFVIGQVQALMTAMGDIFFLGVQCRNAGLFLLASLISSFVYTLFIYSLTIAFSVVGKALVIITLVLQIAGSGGTFPVEVLPQPFQTISPYMPFRYSINALREAVAGPDMVAFRNDILLLLAFVPLALLIGLLLRKPCMKVIAFLESRLHESELLV